MRSISSVLLLLWLLAACQSPAPEAVENVNPCDKVQAIIDSVLAATPNAKGILAYVETPAYSCAAVSGSANETEVLTVQHPILIASNAKTYVAAAMMVAVEKDLVGLDSAIGSYLPVETAKQLEMAGYDLERITVKQLLSHTSGINDYVDADLFWQRAETEPSYHWTRAEQIELACSMEKVGEPGQYFKYADTNYLLAGIVLETITGLDYFKAVSSLLDYTNAGLDQTWFIDMEPRPESALKRAKQYNGSRGLNSYDLNTSFDLYGAGGIAATIEDFGGFYHLLFNNQFFQDSTTLELMLIDIPSADSVPSDYHLGLSGGTVSAHRSYGHGGFWGTSAHHIPELNITIAVCILEKDEGHLRRDVTQLIFDAFED